MRRPKWTENNPWKYRHIILLIAAIFLGLYIAWLAFGEKSGYMGFLLSSFATFICSLTAFLLTGWTYSRLKNEQERQIWLFFTIGTCIWLLSDLLRMFNNGLEPNPVIPEYTNNLTFFFGGIGFLVGVIMAPKKVRMLHSPAILLLDRTITSAVCATLIWSSILQSISFTNYDHQIITALTLGNTAILLVLIYLFIGSDLAGTPLSNSLNEVGVAFLVCSSLANINLYPASPTSQYIIENLGWVVGCLSVALGALIHNQPTSHPSRINRSAGMILQHLQRYLPLYAIFLLVGYALMNWLFLGRIQTLALWMIVMLALVVVARQGFLAGEVEFQKYASLVNSIAEPAFICDRRWHIQLYNPALQEIVGGRQNLIGIPLEDLLHPAEGIRSITRKSITDGWRGECFLLRQNQSPVPISLALRPVRPGDKRLTIAGTAHDLSDQKAQQQALQQAYEQLAQAHASLGNLNNQLEQRVAEKTASLSEAYRVLEEQNRSLQQLDQIKSDFVSLVSHELRAPLTNISGGIELILLNPNHLPDHVRQNLELVQAEIQRLSHFVETILDLSALDAGKMPIIIEPVSLISVASIIQRQTAHLPAARRIDWRIPTEYPYLQADIQALTSVLFHLIDNALKYAPEGSILVNAGVKDNQGWISVSDSGPGIPEESLALIFSRFYRLNASDSQEIYGHGLGLYIAQRLLSAMNGSIEALNKPEGGACFTCWLPLAQAN
ncbi:MAG TPA: PAS domain-containing sensor histidine kinase [Anaerolineaceae bacterium]